MPTTIDTNQLPVPFSSSGSSTGLNTEATTAYGNLLKSLGLGDGGALDVPSTTVSNAAAGTQAGETAGTSQSLQSFTTGMDPATRAAWEKVMGPLQDLTPFVSGAQEGVAALPGVIQDRTQNRLANARITGDEVRDLMNQASNVGANRGFQAGTEPENMRANLLSRLKRSETDRRDAILKDELGLLGSATLAAPGAAQGPLDSLLNLISQGGRTGETETGGSSETTSSTSSANASEAKQTDPSQWVNTLAGLLGVGTESVSSAYSEDPAAWSGFMAQLLTRGYTG